MPVAGAAAGAAAPWRLLGSWGRSALHPPQPTRCEGATPAASRRPTFQATYDRRLAPRRPQAGSSTTARITGQMRKATTT